MLSTPLDNIIRLYRVALTTMRLISPQHKHLIALTCTDWEKRTPLPYLLLSGTNLLITPSYFDRFPCWIHGNGAGWWRFCCGGRSGVGHAARRRHRVQERRGRCLSWQPGSLWRRLNPIFYQAGQLSDPFTDRGRAGNRGRNNEGNRGKEKQKDEGNDNN